jgi:tripartite-type tricarboxylate transporter receptor subunit TctC
MQRDRVNTVHAEVVKLLKTPDVKDRFAQLGAEGVGSTPEAFTVFLKNEITKWEKVVKASGAKAD